MKPTVSSHCPCCDLKLKKFACNKILLIVSCPQNYNYPNHEFRYYFSSDEFFLRVDNYIVGFISDEYYFRVDGETIVHNIGIFTYDQAYNVLQRCKKLLIYT